MDISIHKLLNYYILPIRNNISFGLNHLYALPRAIFP